MMHELKNRYLVGMAILLAILLSGCGGSIPSPTSTGNTPAMVTLQGQLTDAVTGEPIAGARIDIGNKNFNIKIIFKLPKIFLNDCIF